MSPLGTTLPCPCPWGFPGPPGLSIQTLGFRGPGRLERSFTMASPSWGPSGVWYWDSPQDCPCRDRSSPAAFQAHRLWGGKKGRRTFSRICLVLKEPDARFFPWKEDVLYNKQTVSKWEKKTEKRRWEIRKWSSVPSVPPPSNGDNGSIHQTSETKNVLFFPLDFNLVVLSLGV